MDRIFVLGVLTSSFMEAFFLHGKIVGLVATIIFSPCIYLRPVVPCTRNEKRFCIYPMGFGSRKFDHIILPDVCPGFHLDGLLIKAR